MTAEQLATVFAWATGLNLALYLLAVIAVAGFRERLSVLHGRMFGVEPAEMRRLYIAYIATYKLLIIVFCLVPWLALLIAT